MADSNGVVSANEAIVDPVQVTTIHVTPLSSSGEVVLTPLEQIAEPEFVFPPRWRPFLRSDLPLGVCEKLKIALFSVTFMPVRLLFFFLAVVLYSLTVFIVKGCCGASADRFIRFMGRISARAALFSLGFFYISTTGSAGDSADQAPVIVCNHISWLDILVLMAQCNFPSFTAKAAVRDVPFIGYLCSANYAVYVPKNHHPQVGQVLEHPPSQRALAKLSCATYVPAAGSTKDTASADSGSTGQMAGVNARGTRAARSSSVATGAILEHCARAEQGEVPPLAIFPEGTTSNGNQLLYFHKGAFASGRSVQPIVLRYPHRNFSLAWESFFFIPHFLQTLCQFYNRVEVQFLPIYRPSEAEQADAMLYACNVQMAMAAALGVPMTDVTYRDKREYHTWLCQQNNIRPDSACSDPFCGFWCNPRLRVS